MEMSGAPGNIDHSDPTREAPSPPTPPRLAAGSSASSRSMSRSHSSRSRSSRRSVRKTGRRATRKRTVRKRSASSRRSASARNKAAPRKKQRKASRSRSGSSSTSRRSVSKRRSTRARSRAKRTKKSGTRKYSRKASKGGSNRNSRSGSKKSTPIARRTRNAIRKAGLSSPGTSYSASMSRTPSTRGKRRRGRSSSRSRLSQSSREAFVKPENSSRNNKTSTVPVVKMVSVRYTRKVTRTRRLSVDRSRSGSSNHSSASCSSTTRAHAGRELRNEQVSPSTSTVPRRSNGRQSIRFKTPVQEKVHNTPLTAKSGGSPGRTPMKTGTPGAINKLQRIDFRRIENSDDENCEKEGTENEIMSTLDNSLME